MNGLQNMFKEQSNSNSNNVSLNPQQKNIVMQLMTMNEDERAKVIADTLNKQGITSKEQLQNFIKNFKR